MTIGGVVIRPPDARHTPAGVPLGRFVIEHHSRQDEAGLERQVQCRVSVVAAGEALQPTVQQLAIGSAVEVSGFLGRGGGRRSVANLILHADTVTILE